MKAFLSTSRCFIFLVSFIPSSSCLYICLFIVHLWNVILEMGETSPHALLHGPRHGAFEVTDGPAEDDTEPSAVLGNMRYDCDNLISVTTEFKFAEAWRASSRSAVPLHHPSSHSSSEPSTPGLFGEEAPLRNAPGYVSGQNSSAELLASPDEVLFRQPKRCPMDCVARGCRSKCTSAMCHRPDRHDCRRSTGKPRSRGSADDTETDTDSDSETIPRSRSRSGELTKDEALIVLAPRADSVSMAQATDVPAAGSRPATLYEVVSLSLCHSHCTIVATQA